MINAGSAAVALHPSERCPEVGRLPDLVNQAVPFASFHSCSKSRQHALCPHRGFREGPQSLHLRPVYPARGLVPVLFPLNGHCASTFLCPFAPPSFQGFSATMDTLTSVRLSATGQISLLNVTLPSTHSVLNHLMPPCHRFLGPMLFQRDRLAAARSRLSRVTRCRSRATGVLLPLLWISPLPSRLIATSSRSRFALLRTGRSPPAALHPASRRRSCSRLHTEHVHMERTYTALTRCAHRRTSGGCPQPPGETPGGRAVPQPRESKVADNGPRCSGGSPQ